jgi:hypothetical protein
LFFFQKKRGNFSQYNEARDGGRTGAAWEAWRDEQVTQAAAAWVLAGVFVRFMEDNGLIEKPWLSGPGDRLAMARDRHTLYFREHHSHSDREYMLHVFESVAQYPAVELLFDKRFNPLWRLMPSGDGVGELLKYWQGIDPATGELNHDFTDSEWNTRFLGDLYQDLSENIRKQYALLQTPDFIEEFILDRTLTPAIEEFGFQEVRLIDPTCGSGHFLLGAFDRLFALWQQQHPAINLRELAQRTLNNVWGVDLNPYAVAIARFRLLVVVLKKCGITRMADAPGFTIHLAAGDSLLHGPRFRSGGMIQQTLDPQDDPLRQVFETEDKETLRSILGQQYHAVVGNPPYIAVKDPALRDGYRNRFDSCHGKYSLSAPFTERFFDLALQGDREKPSGFVGFINANNFMKREFGKKLIESFLSEIDLSEVIDTSGAYIPGHGTPTVILFGRHRFPVCSTVRTVQGINGEPSTPTDASNGKVWSSIISMIDNPGSENEFIGVVDAPRIAFQSHPWSLGGGGASDLKDRLEKDSQETLKSYVKSIGITAVTGEDDLFLLPKGKTALRCGVDNTCKLVTGEFIRDWEVHDSWEGVWLYDDDYKLRELDKIKQTHRFLWAYKTNISKRKRFGVPMLDRGMAWYEWQELYANKFINKLSIAFAEVASHNHFILFRGGEIFNRSANVIKVKEKYSELDQLTILALLNSSSACFWMKQVCHQKQMMGGDGIRVSDKSKVPYQFNGTALKKLPIPNRYLSLSIAGNVRDLILEMDNLSQKIMAVDTDSIIQSAINGNQSIEKVWTEIDKEKVTTDPL